MKMKMAVMVQEGVRRLLNTSPDLLKDMKVELIKKFNVLMMSAGYT